MTNNTEGWWEEVFMPFIFTCLTVYGLAWIAFEAACLYLQYNP